MDETIPKFKFIRDAYAKRRGRSAMVGVWCRLCKALVMHYQKDGPGPLLRCYRDRIRHPEHLKEEQDLYCPECKAHIGTSIIYEKEQRPAFHLIEGSFKKKKIY